MILWRVSEFAALDGAGGRLIDGRWHSAGRPIVYTAESSALALLAALVRADRGAMPPTFQLLRIEAPDSPASEQFSEDAPPRDLARSQAWGDDWLARISTALARVPAVVAPASFNWLINPAHPDASAIRIVAAGRHEWDARLFAR